MKRYFKIYSAIINQTLINFYQYKFVTYSWLVGKVLEPLVFLIIWITISKTGNGEVSGLQTEYFIRYYILLMIISQFTFTFLIWDFGKQIISGAFTNKLILPLHPIHYDLAENIGYKIFSMPVILLSAIFLYFHFKVTFPITMLKIVVFSITIILSFLLRFILEWTVSLSALWVVQAKAVNELYFILLMFFSGRVAPLEVLPPFVKDLAGYLPFRFMISYPIEVVLNNTLEVSFILKNFCLQVFWIIISLLLLSQVYKRGIKRHTAVGI